MRLPPMFLKSGINYTRFAIHCEYKDYLKQQRDEGMEYRRPMKRCEYYIGDVCKLKNF